MAAVRKGRPGVDCPPYPSIRLSDVACTGLAEALRMSFSPPEDIPVGLFALLKQLEAVTPPQLTTERAGDNDTNHNVKRRPK